MHYRFSIREMIRQDFGVDLPLGLGSGTAIDDPLELEEAVGADYASVEHQYLDYLSRGRGVKFQFQARELLEMPGVRIDVVKIHTRLAETEDPWQSEIYYFDVSRCLLPRDQRRLGYSDFPELLQQLADLDAEYRLGFTKAEREEIVPWLAAFGADTDLQQRNQQLWQQLLQRAMTESDALAAMRPLLQEYYADK